METKNKHLGPLFLLKYIYRSLGFLSFFEESVDDVIRGIQEETHPPRSSLSWSSS